LFLSHSPNGHVVIAFGDGFLLFNDCIHVLKQTADLPFELINRRHEQKSTLVTTHKFFAEWSEVFPSAAYARCVD
jgi:hypothetical protein